MAKAHLLENKIAIVTGGRAGIGGLRVEDNVAIGKDGFDDLSTFNRDL